MALFQHDPGQGGEQREADGEGNQFFLPQHRANATPRHGLEVPPKHSIEAAPDQLQHHTQAGYRNGEDQAQPAHQRNTGGTPLHPAIKYGKHLSVLRLSPADNPKKNAGTL